MSRRARSSQNINKRKKSESSEEEYEVEKILDSRINTKTKKKEYLVKWENWPVSESTWEPAEHLDNVKHMVLDFEEKKGRKQQEKSLSLSHRTSTNSLSNQSLRKKIQISQSSRKRVNSHSSKSISLRNSNAQSKSIKRVVEEERSKSEKKRQSESERRRESVAQINSRSSRQEKRQNQREQFEEQQSKQQKQDDVEELVFEEVLDRRIQNGVKEFLIKFQNYDVSQWIEESNLLDIKDEIRVFEQKLQNRNFELEPTLLLSHKVASSEYQGSDKEGQPSSKLQLRNKSKDQKNQSLLKKQTAKRPTQFFLYHVTSNSSEQKAKVDSEMESMSSHSTNSADSSLRTKTTNQNQQQICEENECLSKSSIDNASVFKLKRTARNVEKTERIFGDFKTDNIERVEFHGERKDILSARFEVFWKTRDNGIKPHSQLYSSSYLKKFRPEILIDFLIPITQQQAINQS